MTGVSLSRWTMSFFAAALVALLVAEAMMVAGYGLPGEALQAPETLILVHVVAIGWLSLLMCGALLQFVPVLVARPLHSNTTPLPALVCLIAGLGLLVLGFLQLSGQLDPGPPLLAIAGALLALGFGLVLWNLARTMWPARPLPVPARFVAVGLASVVATVLFGLLFALVLGGTTAYGPFAAMTGSALSIHAIAGLGGWLTFTAMGVSYRLLAMFMLAPELDGARPRAALHLGTSALATTILAGPAAILLGTGLSAVLAIAGILGLFALVLYGADVIHLYRVRKRRHIELNSRMAAFALASLAAAVLLTGILFASGRLADHIAAVVFLLAFGWLSGLGLAKLYKIIAFLTWLESYGPVLGKGPTPRVQDLVAENRALKWFVLYFLAAWLTTAALLAQWTAIFQVAAAAMLIATLGVVVQFVRARRLADVNAEIRLPEGANRPHLLHSLVRQT